MDNYEIADQLSLLARLMDIHGENSFKAKSYAAAAFTLEKLPYPVAGLAKEKIFAVRGIGESVGKKILEILEKGELEALKGLVAVTPEGVLEMMNIKGLGPKKINVLWKEAGISTMEELEEACAQNKLASRKGFGEKTQQNILEAIRFQKQNSGLYLYAQVESFEEAIRTKLQHKFGAELIEVTGAFRRQLEIIEKLEWVTTVDAQKLKNFFDEEAFQVIAEGRDQIQFQADAMLQLTFHLASRENFAARLFSTTGSDAFVLAAQQLPSWKTAEHGKTEQEIFASLHLQEVPPALRESETAITKARQRPFPKLLQTADIKGLVHSHSNWSDGGHTIEEMARALIETGFEYLVISDHSRAAFYANGLTEERIREQHLYIDELNKKLAPFRIFKSIECDILNDGEMDFPDSVLSTFDLVIASIHSNLTMTEEKAMRRLMGAITNPYVTIMGHLTGRLLAKRRGYPIDHKAIIDACAAHGVVIEVNASPKRLDMDWRWIEYALEKNVMLSINPDAHTIDEFRYIKYGVLTAQKGGLTRERNLSSFSRAEFEKFIQERRGLSNI